MATCRCLSACVVFLCPSKLNALTAGSGEGNMNQLSSCTVRVMRIGLPNEASIIWHCTFSNFLAIYSGKYFNKEILTESRAQRVLKLIDFFFFTGAITPSSQTGIHPKWTLDNFGAKTDI